MSDGKTKSPMQEARESLEAAGKAFGKVGIDMKSMPGVTALEDEETIDNVSVRQRVEYKEPAFTFRDLVTVFLGAQIITAVIVWLTIIITRLKL